MTFDREYFQQIFGIIMGTNIAPIIANLYLAMLQEELKKKSGYDLKSKWSKHFLRFIDDGSGLALWKEQKKMSNIGETNLMV